MESHNFQKRFIESEKFPIDKINEASRTEKIRGGAPPIWDMVFWWTRKPLIGARSVIAGSILPETVDESDFKRLVRLDDSVKGVPHRSNPIQVPSLMNFFRSAKLLDPFGGFGSIPLEAMRLGVGEVVASDLLPTAYVFLKALLEIPKWAKDNNIHDSLVKDVERWGKWIIEELRKDPDIQELYDDAEAYIGSWEVRCPNCGYYTPIIGNWWLAKESGKGGDEEPNEEAEGTKRGDFGRLAWMVPRKVNNKIYIDVIDLNKELNRKKINAKVNFKQGTIEAYGKKFEAPRSNIQAKRKNATCLICNTRIGGDESFYAKQALREWNQNLERYFAGDVTEEQLLNSKARPRIIVKVKKDITFEPVTDEEKLRKALEKLKRIWGDPDVPTEPISEYEIRILSYGFDKFFKLFNPRQLLTFVKLVKLVREVGKRVEDEKSKIWGRDKARKYAEAIVTYLSIVLLKHSDYNCISTHWHSSFLIISNGLAIRGIPMMWNWVDNNPFGNLTGSFIKSLDSLLKGLNYLIDAISDSATEVKVLLDDATKLDKVKEKFDLIVTDPPYRDDVPYTELSDFFYVWLKRTLSDVKEVAGVLMRFPKFYPEAFFDDAGNEIEVQWKRFANEEISEIKGRRKYFSGDVGTFDHFKRLLSDSFKTMADRLTEDGVLVTYYAHTTPEAWEALLEAGWLKAGLRIATTYMFSTESEQRVNARGKISLDTSLAVVWRKGTSSKARVHEVNADAVNDCSKKVEAHKSNGMELFISVLSCVFSHFTRYKEIIGVNQKGMQNNKRNETEKKSFITSLVENYIYPATVSTIVNGLASSSGNKKLSSYSEFYLLSKVLIMGKRNNATRRAIDNNTFLIFSIGTRSDRKELMNLHITTKDKDKIVLIEPSNLRVDNNDERTVKAITNVLEDKQLSPSSPNIRSPIDALHLLEYLATKESKESFKKNYEELQSKYKGDVDEAVELAEILYSVLPDDDIEKYLIEKLLDALDKLPKKGIEKYIS